MKKAGILILFLFTALFISLFLIQVKAEEIDPETGLPVTIKNLSDAGKKLTDKDQNASYVAAEWRKLLLENPAGYVLVKIFDFLKPFLTAIIGTQAGFSWKFAIALFIWLFIFFSIKYILTNFSAFSKTIAGLISLGLTVIIAATKQIDRVAGFLDKLLGKWWGKLIVLIVLIILIALAVMLTKLMEKTKEKQQIEEDKIELHATAQGAKALTKRAGI